MSERKSPEPLQWPEVQRWLKYVDGDLHAAEVLLKEPDLAVMAAFHCQQAAEKLAKAVLVAFAAQYPKIHDIAELGRLVSLQKPDLGPAIASLAGLTDWYVLCRYPVAEFVPSIEDIKTALTKLVQLREVVAALAPNRR